MTITKEKAINGKSPNGNSQLGQRRVSAVAFISITDSPSPLSNWKGVAAAGWELRSAESDEEPERNVVLGDGAHSDESHVAVRAVVAIIACSAAGKVMEIYCRQEWICNAINGLADKWKKGGWKKRAYKKDWQAYLSLREKMGLDVHATHVPKKSPDYADEFELLEQMATSVRDRQARELGTPTGGFEVVPKAPR